MIDAQIAAYDEAWNASDEHTRRRLLEESLTSNAELIDPSAGTVRGRTAINKRIAGFSDRFPGARVTVTSGVDAHNGFARYGWTITDREGKAMLDGIDVVERAEDGRIKRVIMFFGRLPAADH